MDGPMFPSDLISCLLFGNLIRSECITRSSDDVLVTIVYIRCKKFTPPSVSQSDIFHLVH